jgi:hypothetical protein
VNYVGMNGNRSQLNLSSALDVKDMIIKKRRVNKNEHNKTK